MPTLHTGQVRLLNVLHLGFSHLKELLNRCLRWHIDFKFGPVEIGQRSTITIEDGATSFHSSLWAKRITAGGVAALEAQATGTVIHGGHAFLASNLRLASLGTVSLKFHIA